MQITLSHSATRLLKCLINNCLYTSLTEEGDHLVVRILESGTMKGAMRLSSYTTYCVFRFCGGLKLARGTTFGSQNQSGGPKFSLQTQYSLTA